MSRGGEGHKVRHGAAWSAVYGIASILSGIALLPIVIASVGAGPYGVWLLLSTLSTYLYQADLGMGAAIVHFMSRSRDAEASEQRALMSASFTWMSVAGLVATPIYVLIALLIVHGRGDQAGLSSSESSSLVVLGALLIVLLGLRVFPAALQGSGYWVYQRRTQLIGVGVRIAGTLIACLIIDDIVAVAAAEVIALLLPMALSTFKAARLGLARMAPRDVKRETLIRLLRYSTRSFAVAAMAAILLQADTLIVGLIGTATAVTYYGAAFRVYASVRQVLGWITDPLLPAMTRLWITSREQAQQLMVGMLFLCLWSAVGACGALAIAAPDVIRLWLGDSVPADQIATVSRILLFGLMFNAAHVAAIPASDATGRPGAFLRLHMWWCGLNVVLSLALGYWVGIVGVALGTTIPLLILEPLYLRRIEQQLGISPRRWLAECLKPVLAALAGGLICAAVVWVAVDAAGVARGSWLAAGCVFAVSYAGVTGLRRAALPIHSLRVAANAPV